jgi:hypothetical protein
MAFPVTAALFDDFDRADGNVVVGDAGQWAEEGINGGTNKLATAGSQLKAEGASGNGRSATILGPDVEMYTTLRVLPTVGSYLFFAARITPGTKWTGYGAIIIRTAGNSFLCQIRKYTNGGNQTPGGWATATTTFEVGDGFGWSVVNNEKGIPVIAIYRRHEGVWALLAEQPETAFSYLNEGPIGIEFGDNSARIDDLFAGTVGEEPEPEEHEGSSSVSGGGSVSAAGFKGAASASSVSGGGDVASHGHKEASGSSAVTGGGSIDEAGHKTAFGATSISGGGGLAHTAAATRFGSSSVSGGGSVSSSGKAGGPIEPCHLALGDERATHLLVSDQPVTGLALADEPTTYLTLEDEPHV